MGFFLILFIPSIAKEARVKLDCNDGISQFKYCKQQNETFEECAIAALLNITDDSVMKCKANCYIEPARWDEVCRNWKIKEDCTIAQEYIDFESYSPRKHYTATDNSCLFMRIDWVQFNSRNSTLMCPAADKFFETDCTISCNDPQITELIAPDISDKTVSITMSSRDLE